MHPLGDQTRSATICDVFEKAQLTGKRSPSRKRSTRAFGGDFQNRVRRQGKSRGNVHFSKGETKTTICGELVNYPENPRLCREVKTLQNQETRKSTREMSGSHARSRRCVAIP